MTVEQQVWLSAACAVIADYVNSVYDAALSAAENADGVLAEFRKRWPAEVSTAAGRTLARRKKAE